MKETLAELKLLSVLVGLLFASQTASAQELTVTAVGSSSQQAVIGDVVTLQFSVTPYVGAENIALSLKGVDLTTGNPIMFLSVSDDRQSIYLNPAMPAHQGEYRLTATNGSDESSASIFLDILSPPGLSKVPEDVVEHERETAVFECFATGDPTPTVEWIFNGTVIDTNTGKYHIGKFGNPNFGSLTIYNLTYSDHGVYACNASNTVTFLTVSAELFVQQYPVIVGDPENTKAPAGRVAKLNCYVTGYPLPNIVWMKDGMAISHLNGDGFSTTTTSFEYQLLSHSVLMLDGPVLSDNGLYSCNATNELKTLEVITSAAAILSIQYPPSVTVNTKSITVNQTNSVTLYCEGFGIPEPELTWKSSNDPSQTLQGTSTLSIHLSAFVNGSALTIIKSTLQISNVTRSAHEANFSCVGENGVENFIGTPELATTELIVQVPVEIVQDPVDTTHFAGGSTSLFCSASGILSPAFVWYKDGQQMFEGGRVTIFNTTLTDTPNEVVIRSTLSFTNLMLSDDADYFCEPSNPGAYGTTFVARSDTAHLIVEHPPNVSAIGSVECIVNHTQTAEFVCQAFGIPVPNITWIKVSSGSVLSTGVDDIEITEVIVDSFTLVSNLTFLSTKRTDQSEYTCVGSNGITNIISTSESDIVNLLVQFPVEIEQDPVETTHFAGGTISLFCSASGIPSPAFVWYKNGQQVLEGGRETIFHTTLTDIPNEVIIGNTLSFTNLMLSDDADYFCEASNPGAYGTEFVVRSDSAHLNVQQVMTTSTVTPTQTNPSGISSVDLLTLIVPSSIILLICIIVLLVCFVRCLPRIMTQKKSSKTVIEEFELNLHPFANLSQLRRSGAAEKVNPKDIAKLGGTSLILGCRLKTMERIGQGEFGVVHKGHYYHPNSHTPMVVAIKSLKGNYSEEEVHAFLVESIQMKEFSHPHVMGLLGVSLDSGPCPCLVLPFMAGGSLLAQLKEKRSELVIKHDAKTNVDQVRKCLISMCLQIAKGMEYLATNKIVHRDLAARNCMLDGEGIIKVGDFGLSKHLYEKLYFREDRKDGVKLPFKWMAIESLQDGVFSEQTDVWSFGVTCWEVFSGGKMPYPGVSPLDLTRMLASGERMGIPDNSACSEEIFYMIMFQCWMGEPQERPTFSQLVVDLSTKLAEMANYLDLNEMISTVAANGTESEEIIMQ